MESNLKRLQSALRDGKFRAGAVLVTSHENRLFSTGFSSTAGAHIVTPDASVFLTDFRYIEAATAAIADTEVHMMERGQTYADRINEVCRRLGVGELAYEDTTMTVAERDAFAARLEPRMTPAGKAFSHLRAVKNEAELENMRRAQRITDAALAELLPTLRLGMTEREIQSELIYRLYRCGADGLSFDPIVVSGPNSSLPHGKATDRVVGPGEFVTMDFGVLCRGYCSDMTRTVCFGEPTAEMREVYELVLRAQRLGLDTARAGLHYAREYDGVVRRFLTDAGFGPNFGHGLGHGLGIEIHESLDFDDEHPGIMPENGVVSCEPGIYLAGRFGVRIEDCVVLMRDGCENLTKSPKELLSVG
ncbi:MAG: aminopeptidase P family protein [Oscillospiraceae bacterium]|nr:aminopeptidase P family protein [Oscillospiraceae bacterium]